MATDYRSASRSVGVSFRMTAEERARLQEEATKQGYSIQQLLEARVFGAAKPRRKPGPQPQSERLDLSA